MPIFLPLAATPSHHAPGNKGEFGHADHISDAIAVLVLLVVMMSVKIVQPGLSLHDRAFRPLRPRRRAGLQPS
jgi:hypothetical protein